MYFINEESKLKHFLLVHVHVTQVYKQKSRRLYIFYLHVQVNIYVQWNSPNRPLW